MYLICVTEISSFLTTIHDHVNVFVPLKILRRTNRTLHAEPFTNTQYHFLVIVESAIMHAPNYLFQVVGISSVQHTIYCLINLYTGYMFRLA